MALGRDRCDNRVMGETAVHHLPVGRHLAVDEQGVGLRVTWRLDRGFVNLSLWREDRCVETFHLTPVAAAELMAFLARGLADASEVAAAATVRPLPSTRPSVRRHIEAAARSLRHRAAHALSSAGDRLGR